MLKAVSDVIAVIQYNIIINLVGLLISINRADGKQ